METNPFGWWSVLPPVLAVGLAIATRQVVLSLLAGIWIGSLDEDERDSLARYALIAATARERGEPVCTSDPESYSRFYSELVGY